MSYYLSRNMDSGSPSQGDMQSSLKKIFEQQELINQGMQKMQLDIYEIKQGPIVEVGGSLSKDVDSVSDLQGIIKLSKIIFDSVGNQWAKNIDKLNNAADLLNHALIGSWQYNATHYSRNCQSVSNDDQKTDGLDDSFDALDQFVQLVKNLEDLVPLSNCYKNDKEATWILIPVYRLITDILRVIGTMLVRDKHLLDNHETRCRLVKSVTVLQEISEDTSFANTIKALAKCCLSLVEEQSGFLNTNITLMFVKVHDKVSQNMSPGLISSLENFQQFHASKQLRILSQVSPLRSNADSVASYQALVNASNAYRASGNNWLLTSTYLNTLLKYAVRAVKNLSTERDSAKEILQACIIGDCRVTGLTSILDQVRKRSLNLRRAEGKDFVANAFLDAEAFAGFLRSTMFDCAVEITKSIEQFALDRLISFSPFKDKYAKTITSVTRELGDDLLSIQRIFEEVDHWVSTCDQSTKKAMDHLNGMSKIIEIIQAHLYMFGPDEFTTNQHEFKKKLSNKLVQLFPRLTGDSMTLPLEDFWQRVEDLNFIQFQTSRFMESVNMLSLLLMIVQLRIEEMKKALESTVLRCTSEIKEMLENLLPKLTETNRQIDRSGILTNHSPTTLEVEGSVDNQSANSSNKSSGVKMKFNIFNAYNNVVDKNTPKGGEIVNLTQVNMIFDSLAAQVPMIHTRFSTIVNCVHEYYSIFEISSQVISQTEEAFFQMSEKSIPGMSIFAETCHTYCRTGLRPRIEIVLKELQEMFTVPNSDITGPSMIVRPGWWKTISELWLTCSVDANAMSIIRSGLQKLIYCGGTSSCETYPKVIEETIVAALLDVDIACRDILQLEFEGGNEADTIRELLSPFLDVIAHHITRSRLSAFGDNRLFRQCKYQDFIQKSLVSRWPKIERQILEDHRTRLEALDGLRSVLDNADDRVIADQHGLLDTVRSIVEDNSKKLLVSIAATLESLKMVPASNLASQKLERLRRYVKTCENKCLQRVDKVDNRTNLVSDPSWKPPVDHISASLNAKQSKLSMASIAKLKRNVSNEKKVVSTHLKEKSSVATVDLMSSPGGVANISSVQDPFEMPVLLSRDPPSKRPSSANHNARYGGNGTPIKKDPNRDKDVELAGVINQINIMSTKLDQFLKDYGKVNVLIDQLQSERLSFNPAKAFWDSIKELEDRLTAVIKSKLNNLNRPSTATYQSISVRDSQSNNGASGIANAAAAAVAAVVGPAPVSNTTGSANVSTSLVEKDGNNKFPFSESPDTQKEITSNGVVLYSNTELFLNKIETTIDMKVKEAFESLISDMEKRIRSTIKQEVVPSLSNEDSISLGVVQQGKRHVTMTSEEVAQIAEKLVTRILEDMSSHSRAMIQNMVMTMTAAQQQKEMQLSQESNSGQPAEESKEGQLLATSKPTPINIPSSGKNALSSNPSTKSTDPTKESPAHKRSPSKDGPVLPGKSAESPSHSGVRAATPKSRAASFNQVDGRLSSANIALAAQAAAAFVQESNNQLPGGVDEKQLPAIAENNIVTEHLGEVNIPKEPAKKEEVPPFTIDFPKPIDYSSNFLQLEDRMNALTYQVEAQQHLFSAKWNQLDSHLGGLMEQHFESFHTTVDKKYAEQYQLLETNWNQSKQELLLNIEHRLTKFDGIVQTVKSINQDMIQGRQVFEERIVRFFTRMHEIHDESIEQLTQFIQHKFTNMLTNSEQQLEFILMKNYHLAYQQVIEELRTSMLLNVSDSIESCLCKNFSKFFQMKNFKALEELIFALDERIPAYFEEEMEKNNELLGRMMAETAVLMKNEVLNSLKSNNQLIVNEVAGVFHEGMIANTSSTTAFAVGTSEAGLITLVHPSHHSASHVSPTQQGVNLDAIYTNEDALFITKDYKRLQQLLKQVAQTLLAKMNHMQKQFTGRYEELITFQSSRIEPRFDFIDHYLKQQHRLVSQKTFSYRKQQQTLAQQFAEKKDGQNQSGQLKVNSRPSSPGVNRSRDQEDSHLVHSQSEPVLEHESRTEYNPATMSQIMYNMPRRPRPTSPTFPKAERFYKTREEEAFSAQMFESFKKDITTPQPFSPYATKLREAVKAGIAPH